ncbi:MAG: class I SAM-dependent methyltransferase [Promethearchaeota archaeon]|jgi:SAM-dependent methyltransferase
MSDGKYRINANYKHREEVLYFDDTGNTDNYQDIIYEKAFQFFSGKNCNNVLDLGCGSAYKLFKYFGDSSPTGVDLPETVEFLKDKYPTGNWLVSDFENPPKERYDMVICADMIEHVMHPDEVFEFINNLDFQYLILSTPDRDRIKNYDKFLNGPPRNKCHVREWSSEEFKLFVSDYFTILFNSLEDQHDHMVICEKKK